MATETGDTPAFERISRTTGRIFHGLLVVATWVGIVSLGVLLAFVFNDAVRPLTADPGWLLTFFLTLVAPTAVAALWLRERDDAAMVTGVTFSGVLVASLLLAAALSVLFVELVPLLAWLGGILGVAGATAVVVAHGRVRPDAGAFERGLVGFVAFGYALFGVPGYVESAPEFVTDAPFVPDQWTILTLTVGLPVGLLVKTTVDRYAEADWNSWTTEGTQLGLGVVLVGVAGAFGLPALGLGVVEATLLPIGLFGGAVLYAERVRWLRPDEGVALLFPAVLVAGALVGAAAVDALGFAGPNTWLDWGFLTSAHSGTATNAGLYPPLIGSILLMLLVAVLSFPVGVGAAVYLEEYAADTAFTRFIQVNISNLAGVPSVVYGLLGLGLFVNRGGMEDGTVLVAGMTLSLLILPIVIISSQEAIRAVPDSMRQASYGMGATRWQTIRRVVLPRAFPGILTGTILAIGRAIGETAPLIMIGAPSVVRRVPGSLGEPLAAMPMQVYAWATLFASPEFYETAVAAGVVTLVTVLLLMNATAIVLRNRYQIDH